MKVKDRKVKVLKSDVFEITEYGLKVTPSNIRILASITNYHNMFKAYLFIDNGIGETECFEEFQNAENWILDQDLSKFKQIPQ